MVYLTTNDNSFNCKGFYHHIAVDVYVAVSNQMLYIGGIAGLFICFTLTIYKHPRCPHVINFDHKNKIITFTAPWRYDLDPGNTTQESTTIELQLTQSQYETICAGYNIMRPYRF